jgi:exodeoxyribonuclease VII small subunit
MESEGRTLKQMLDRLEEITQMLEREDLGLEEGLELFEEGVNLLRESKKKLTEARSRVERLLGSLEEGVRVEEILLREE